MARATVTGLMKNTETAESTTGVNKRMTKANVRGMEGKALGVQSIAPIPMEWMGPAAWRLPSGKALAEFALQAGFLAPLLLGDGPFWRRKKTQGNCSDRISHLGLREGGNGFDR